MGTLTANQPLLPEYCEHKLPTSCRLTSIPNCCACADERAQAASYRTYIDGIGFVPRGTRWQRYCWFCKEFWEKRVEVSGLRSGQTRIPLVPDQTLFIERWYEFYRGYRIVKKDDGTEERVSVLGEEFRNVSPGCLPRTLEELRAGRQQSELATAPAQNVDQEEQRPSGPSLDETLDQLFQDASLEETRQAPNASQIPPVAATAPAQQDRLAGNPHAQVMVPTGSRSEEYRARRANALRRELLRMRNGIERVISGLRDLGQEVPDHNATVEGLSSLTQDSASVNLSGADAQRVVDSVTELISRAGANQSDGPLAALQSRVDAARSEVEEARRARDQLAEEMAAADSSLQTCRRKLEQLQRERASAENYMRTFGTREEMAQQGENYVSPIRNMFSRAEERFNVAEEVRQSQRAVVQGLADEAMAMGVTLDPRTVMQNVDTPRDVWGVPAPSVRLSDLPWPQLLPLNAHYVSPLGIKGDEFTATELQSEIMLPVTDAAALPEDWLLCATFTISALREDACQGRSLPQEMTPASLSELALSIERRQLALAQITLFNNLFTDHLLMWRYGVPQFLVFTLRMQYFLQGVAPRSTLPWLECIGSMELAFRMSRILQQYSGRNGEETANIVHRLQNGQRIRADLDLILSLVTSFYNNAWFEEALLEIDAGAWLRLDARYLLQAFAHDENLRSQYNLSPVQIEEHLAQLDAEVDGKQLMIPSVALGQLKTWANDHRLIIQSKISTDWVMRQKKYILRGGQSLYWDQISNSEKSEEERVRREQVNHHLAREFTRLAFILSAEVRRRVPASQHRRLLDELSAYHITTWAENALTDLFRTSAGLIHRVVKTQIEVEAEQEIIEASMIGQTSNVAAVLNGERDNAAEEARTDAEASASREAAQQMAIAAGRQAMQTGSRALMERMQTTGHTQPQSRLGMLEAAGFLSTPSPQVWSFLRDDENNLASQQSDGEDVDSDELTPRGLDAIGTGRPDPKTDEEMNIMMDCRICFTQIADVACLPCGHLAMCRWCSDQHSPSAANDRTRPLRPTPCPVCRKRIRSKHRVFRP